MPLKNSNDTIGNRTCYFPACSAVPQPTAPPSACPASFLNLFIWCLSTLAIVQAVSRRPLAAESRVRSRAGTNRVYGGQSGQCGRFFGGCCGLCCECDPASALYSFIHIDTILVINSVVKQTHKKDLSDAVDSVTQCVGRRLPWPSLKYSGWRDWIVLLKVECVHAEVWTWVPLNTSNRYDHDGVFGLPWKAVSCSWVKLFPACVEPGSWSSYVRVSE
jgi:hypothetical protein